MIYLLRAVMLEIILSTT